MAILHTAIAALAILGPAQTQKIGYDKGDIEWAANTMICNDELPDPEQSGYVTVPRGLGNETAEIFFWHFPAYENASTAPLAVIIGGGLPGVPATEKIFGRNGPCVWDGRTGDKEIYGNLGPSTNYFGFNMRVNTLYIDAPTPVGFSHGSPANVSTTKRDVWHVLQIFLREFDQYYEEGRSVALWNYDFGAHYAAHAAAYIHAQNERIRDGSLDGATVVNLTSLGLVSPLLDLPIQHEASIEFAHDNPYGQVITRGLRNDLLDDFAENHAAYWRVCAEDVERSCKWEQSKDYRTQLHRLTIGEHYVDPPPVSVHKKLKIDKEAEEREREEKRARKEAEKEAEQGEEEEEEEEEEEVVEEEDGGEWEDEPDVASYDPWDIRLPRPGDRWRVLSEVAPERSERTERFMGREELQNWVGADLKGKKAYSSLNHAVWAQVMAEQAMMRSSLKALRQVVHSGIRVLIVGGDADLMSCSLGVSRLLDAVQGANATTWTDMEPKSFMARSRPMQDPISEKDKLVGKIGEYREKDNVSWLLLSGTGHDIETEDPQTMLLLFTRHVHGWPFDGYLAS